MCGEDVRGMVEVWRGWWRCGRMVEVWEDGGGVRDGGGVGGWWRCKGWWRCEGCISVHRS